MATAYWLYTEASNVILAVFAPADWGIYISEGIKTKSLKMLLFKDNQFIANSSLNALQMLSHSLRLPFIHEKLRVVPMNVF